MDRERAYLVMQQVAERNNVSVECIEARINEIIVEGFESAMRSGDKKSIQLWKAVPCEGDMPTPIEFVDYLGKLMVSFEKYMRDATEM